MVGSQLAPQRAPEVRLDREAAFRLGSAWVDPPAGEVVAGAFKTRLQPRVMQVLVALARAEGAVVSRDDLIALCWRGSVVGEDAINRCIQRLRRLGEEAPGSFTIETMPRVGYRLTARPHQDSSRPVDAEPDGLSQPHPRHRTTAARRFPVGLGWRGGTAGGVAVVGAVVLLLAIVARLADTPQTLAIRPFRSAASARGESLSAALAGELTRMTVGSTAPLALGAPRRGGLLGRLPDYVLDGDEQGFADARRIDVYLHAGASGEILWSHEFSQQGRDPGPVLDEMAAVVGGVLSCLRDRKALEGGETDHSIVRTYLRACEERRQDWPAAAKLLAEVVRRRPGFAHAWAMLSALTAGYALDLPQGTAGNDLASARAYAERALALHRSEAEAYVGLAGAQSGLPSWPKRYALLQAGLKKEPENADLNVAMASQLLTIGRVREASLYARRGAQLDPFNPIGAWVLLNAFTALGERDELDVLLDRADRLWPRDSFIGSDAFRIAARAGDPGTAARWLVDPRHASDVPFDRYRLWMAVLHARDTRASSDVKAAVDLIEADSGGQQPSLLLGDAANLVILGQPRLALNPLARIGPNPVFTEILFYDYMAPLWSEPGFLPLTERLGLADIWRRTRVPPDLCQDPHLRAGCDRLLR